MVHYYDISRTLASRLWLIVNAKQFEKYSKTNDELKDHYESYISEGMKFNHGLFADA